MYCVCNIVSTNGLEVIKWLLIEITDKQIMNKHYLMIIKSINKLVSMWKKSIVSMSKIRSQETI